MNHFPKPFFDVGDTVLIRGDNSSQLWKQAELDDNACDVGYMNEMDSFRGKPVTITFIGDGYSTFKEDPDDYNWSNISFVKATIEANEDMECFLKHDKFDLL